MRTREQTIFRYAELGGAAKDRARDWMVEGLWDSVQDELRERFKELLSDAGFPGATDIYFSLGRVQGDGVTFDDRHFDLKAWLRATPAAAVSQEARDHMEEFKRLAREDSLNISIQTASRGARHFNPPRVMVEPTYRVEAHPGDEEAIAQLEKAIQESVDDVCRAMTREGYEIIEFREGDEELSDLAEANDYEFDEQGRPT